MTLNKDHKEVKNMAAGLLAEDTMFSVGERPWHGIGLVVDTAPTSAEAIKMAGLDWTVEKQPLFTANGNEAKGYFANVRSDTGRVLGVVKDKYKIVQNADSFNFVDDLMAMSGECKYETAGSLHNGAKTWLLVKMPETNLVGDKVENYLFFMNSHNGTSGIVAGVSSVRVVCNNTLQFAMNESEKLQRQWHVTHRGNIEGKLEEAKASLKLANAYVEQERKVAMMMAEKKVNEERFFRELFESWKKTTGEDTVKKIANEIHEIYQNKEDLQNFKGTAWGLWNAVCDWESNRKSKGTNEKKLSKFFTGNKLITLSQEILVA